MARITLPQADALMPEQQDLYQRFPSNLTRALLRTGACTAGYLTLGASFRQGHLCAKDRELVILRVAALSNSAYERMQHINIAKNSGWSEINIDAIEHGEIHKLDSKSQAIVRFTDECVNNIKVTHSVFNALRSHYSEEEMAEITLLIGHYMMTARFLETLDIELDDGPTSWENIAVNH